MTVHILLAALAIGLDGINDTLHARKRDFSDLGCLFDFVKGWCVKS